MPTSYKGDRRRSMRKLSRTGSQLLVDYLIIGGGGAGGGGWFGGGGGAGGYIYRTSRSLALGSYAIVVGAGGSSDFFAPGNGASSSFNGETALGGGHGAVNNDMGVTAAANGASGGGGYPTGGSGTEGQGYAGGTGYTSANPSGAGGGGANGQGSNGSAATGGNGGAGINNSITGTSTGYSGGGAGSTESGTQGTATHGGGNVLTAGSTNTGGGGGAGKRSTTYPYPGQAGKAGGSGVVIVRYKTNSGFYASGGIRSDDGEYTVRKFTSSGTLEISATPLPIDYNTALVMETTATICTLGGRTFTKSFSDWCISGYFYNSGYTGPLLVGLTENSVKFNGGGGDMTYAGTVVYNGVTYYYSSTGYFMGGNLTDTSGTGRIKMTATSEPSAAIELLDRYFLNGY